MKKSFKLLSVLLILFQFFALTAHAQKKTSKKSKKEIPTVHYVKSGETLYGLSAKYGVSIDDLKKTNPQLVKGLQTGQKLKIPSKNELQKKTEKTSAASSEKKVPADEKKSSVKETKEQAVKTKTNETKLHTVKKGETLSSIARKYNLSQAELRNLNGMKGDVVKINQKLVVSKTAKPKNSEKTAKATVADKSANKEEKPKTEPLASKKTVTDPEDKDKKKEETRPLPLEGELLVVKPERPSSDVKEITEVGLAEAIEGDLSTPQYLALHKSAPIGTVIRMTNEITGLGVFVKVIGKLPDTGLNEKVLIKVSGNAYDKIGASGKRFLVRLDYYR